MHRSVKPGKLTLPTMLAADRALAGSLSTTPRTFQVTDYHSDGYPAGQLAMSTKRL